jgi:nitrogen regulatory protein P-II 1
VKKIEVFIRPYKLDVVREGLQEAGFSGLTVTEVKGYGGERNHTEVYRGAEHTTDSNPKIKIEIICSDASAEKAISIVVKHAKTSEVGDGRIFVLPVEEVIRVRTEETGESAL